MTIRLDNEVQDRLDRLAASTHCRPSALAAYPSRAFAENIDWQGAEIEATPRQADADDCAGRDEAAAPACKSQSNAG